MKMKKMTKKGFTLVELLVVIAILAVLAAVSIVGYTTFIKTSKDSAAMQELNQVKTFAVSKYSTTKAMNALTDADLVESEIGDTSSFKFVIKTTGAGESATTEVVAITYDNGKGSAYWALGTGEVIQGAYMVDATKGEALAEDNTTVVAP